MNISIIGLGYVGLVSGACFATFDHNVTCVDIDSKRVDTINKGISPIFEKDLEEILKKHANNITATTSYEKAIQDTDITFICVGTPSMEDGDIDLTYIDQVTREIGKQLKKKEGFHSVVVKSTVVPGTTQRHIIPFLEQASGKKAGTDFGVGMNPEFLREGVAVDDFLHPDRVVNGFLDERTRQLLSDIYKKFSCPILETSLSVAEMIKYASNCFLATKISFINEVGNYCKNLGIDVYEVADGMGLDKRIERSFLNAGIGWGGSCFPKDTRALRAWAGKQKLPCNVVDSVIRANDIQPLQLIALLKKHIHSLEERTIGVLGLAFKPDTDDIRDSRSIPLIKQLVTEEAVVKAYDPEAMDEFKPFFPDIHYCSSAEEVLDSDAVIIATIWDEFKTIDFSGLIVIDGRKHPNAAKTARIYEGVCW